MIPSNMPSWVPSELPSILPSEIPSNVPSKFPSVHPSFIPSSLPSLLPSSTPSFIPSNKPSAGPSMYPSLSPSAIPTLRPSVTQLPSIIPSYVPSVIPSLIPSTQPSVIPSITPSLSPTQCDGNYLDITVRYDRYPRENSWSLKQGSNTIRTFSGEGDSNSYINAVVVDGLCLQNGFDYTWTILDKAEDGICCNEGNGYYELELNGVVIASGSDFGEKAEHIFYSGSNLHLLSQVGSDINGDGKYDQSGISVSCSYDCSIIAVGTKGNGLNTSGSGHVRVYQWTNGSWSQLGADIQGTVSSFYFGRSVSLSSNGLIVAIGAEHYNSQTSVPGYVCVYEYTNDSWSQKGNNINGDATKNLIGAHIQLSENGLTFIVGGYGNGGNGADSGHVQVYQWDVTAWSQLGSDIEGISASDWSGRFVDISGDGNTVAVGRVVNGSNGASSGNVRVFTWSGNTSTWLPKGNGIDSESANDESVCLSLSSDGNIIAIGSFENDGNGSDSGHVRVYEWSGTTWDQVGNDIDGESAGDHFGYSVSISSNGHILAVGAPLSDANGSDSGKVRLFKLIGDAWLEIGYVLNGEAGGDEFGFEVSLSSTGQRVVIGALNNDDNGLNSGHVRVYELHSPPTTAPSSSSVATL